MTTKCVFVVACTCVRAGNDRRCVRVQPRNYPVAQVTDSCQAGPSPRGPVLIIQSITPSAAQNFSHLQSDIMTPAPRRSRVIYCLREFDIGILGRVSIDYAINVSVSVRMFLQFHASLETVDIFHDRRISSPLSAPNVGQKAADALFSDRVLKFWFK